MADPNLDPLAAQLYGMPAPDLVQPAEPWSWIPSHWNEPAQPQSPPIAPDPVAALPPPVDAELAGNPALPAPEPAVPQPRVAELPDFAIGYEQPPPIPPAVDAITGGPPLGSPTRTPDQLPEAHYRASVGALQGGSPWDENGNLKFADRDEGRRYLQELAVRSPKKFIEVSQDLEDIKFKRALADQQRVENENWERQQANARMRAEAFQEAQQKSAAIEADAMRLAATKIDPSGGVTGSRRLAGVVAALVGGLVQGRTGSARNAGLDAFIDTINRGIEAQKADIENRRQGITLRRSMLADEYARHGDMFHAAEAVRLAAYQHARDLIDAERQKFARGGTTDLRLAATQAAMDVAALKDKQDRDDKLRDRAFKNRQQDEIERNNKMQNQLRAKELEGQAADRQLARQQRADDRAAERASAAAERERRFSIGGIPRVRVVEGKPVMGQDGKPVIDYDVLRNKDGSVWLAPSDEAERELRTKKTTTTEVVSIIREIRAIRGRVGGESRLLNSRDAQRLKVLQARAQLLTKQGTQGMSSDKDMETIQDAAGTADADSWRDQEGKLVEAEARSISALNQAFRDAKYSGDAIDFPEAKPTESTVDEIRFQNLLEKPNESIGEARRQIETARAAGFPDIGYNPDASIKQQIGIAELGQDAAGPANDDRATLARTRLQKLAAEAPTSALRQLARVTLESALRSGLSSSEETTTATGAREIRGGERSTATPVPDELRVR